MNTEDENSNNNSQIAAVIKNVTKYINQQAQKI